MTDYDPLLVERLTAINLEDTLVSLGWEKVRAGRKLLEWPFQGAARLFARQVLGYDACVASLGLQAGAQAFVKTLLKDLTITGQDRIPASGPVLFISNHPGMTDTVSLFASIPRSDLKIVAAERPFLRALPATATRLIFVPEDSTGKMNVIRQAAAELRRGGAVLTFPAGHIEPDPRVLPGAVAALQDWGSSIGVFARLVPETVILPAMVSGVLSPQATHHPLTRLRHQKKDRERLGATLQILASVLFPNLWRDLWNVTVRVDFGPPIPAAGLVALHEPERITAAVVAQVRAFYEERLRESPGSNATQSQQASSLESTGPV